MLWDIHLNELHISIFASKSYIIQYIRISYMKTNLKALSRHKRWH